MRLIRSDRRSSDKGKEGTPVPIPNTEVKLLSAEGSTQVRE